MHIHAQVIKDFNSAGNYKQLHAYYTDRNQVEMHKRILLSNFHNINQISLTVYLEENIYVVEFIK